MNTMHFHSYLFPTSPLISSRFTAQSLTPESILRWPYSHRCRAIYWSMVDLPGTTLSKKKKTWLFLLQHLPSCSTVRVGEPLILHAEVLIGLVMHLQVASATVSSWAQWSGLPQETWVCCGPPWGLEGGGVWRCPCLRHLKYPGMSVCLWSRT